MAEKYYPDTSASPDFPKIEENILKFWQENKLFQESINTRPIENQHTKDKKEFVFYDGPPFANGLPHYGHLLTGFVKDLFGRYQTIKGKKVERKFGWDCHGLPAEMGAEKELGISGRIKIMEYGVDKFNDVCRKSVMKYTSEWEDYVTRQARWVDFKNDYKTMDISFMESVLWAFKQLYDKGLVYESMRVMPYSWACETPLSNFETRLDNSYRERADKAATVSFKLKTKPNFIKEECASYKILAWTTTPWTLPSNLALAVNTEMDYTYVIKDNEALVLACFAINNYAKEIGVKEEQNFPIVKGKELLELNYEPMFDYFKDQKNAFRILKGDFVIEGDGTGIVHLAPGFGEDDQIVCAENNIDIVCPVDQSGKFTAEVYDFQGMNIFDAIDEVIKALKVKNLWIRTEQYLHNYPHCWRTDTPLIFKAVPSWYVAVTKFKDRMVELNQQINWIPGHVRDGLFGKWLENARDWSISRNRFWGTPIPIWKSDDPKYPRIDVYGSIAEIERDFGVKVTDLHKPFIDNLVRPNPNDPTGKSMMRRVPDVFDCWFESGSMPYGQVHYPFENKEWFEKHFSADFIVEYTAQTRGWFYTLMVLSTALFDRPPFLNCICHGVILDEKGQKLSKRLNNYADPKELFAMYGADSLRFLMVSSAVMRGQELLIDKEGRMVRDTLRLSIKPIWNAYNFFTLYANADNTKANIATKSDNLMDKYILAKMKFAILALSKALDNFDTPTACIEIDKFFEVLNNWYIRRSRQRFWKTEKDNDKQSAYNILYTILNYMCRAISPILPYLTEEIYQGIEANGQYDPSKSVHLALFPDVIDIEENSNLVSQMDIVRDICNSALAIRNRENIRVRQPLGKLMLLGGGYKLDQSLIEVIKDEVNVKNVEFGDISEDIASFKLQFNFPILGKRLPYKVKDIIAASKQGKWERIADGRVKIIDEVIEFEECKVILEVKDKKSCENLSNNDALVQLNLEITEELKLEGIARDVVRMIQQARKDAGLYISDRIILSIKGSENIVKAVNKYAEYINEQTLAEYNKDSIVSTDGNYFVTEGQVEDEKVQISLAKK